MREFGEPVSATKPSGCFKYLLYAGCATFIFILAFFALGIIGFLGALSPYDLPEGWENKILPPRLQTTRVIYKKHRGIWRDQCEYAAYEIASSTLLAIDKGGLTFLDDAVPPLPTRDGSPYIGWRKTPVENSAPENSRLFAMGADDGCHDNSDKAQLPDGLRSIRSAMTLPGGYYTITRNGYGMIVVLPEAGVILFLYST
jgi:hypothetical protein